MTAADAGVSRMRSRPDGHHRTHIGAYIGAYAALALLAAGDHHFQPRLAAELHAIKDTEDVYPLPPPPALRLATLGYIAATTDVLWGKIPSSTGPTGASIARSSTLSTTSTLSWIWTRRSAPSTSTSTACSATAR